MTNPKNGGMSASMSEERKGGFCGREEIRMSEELNPKYIFETKIPEGMKADPGKVANIKAVYLFKITGDDGGTWFVDLTGDAPVVGAGEKQANCTITCASADFVNIVSGKLNGQMAFMTGKLKIAGDMGLAMKLQKIIG